MPTLLLLRHGQASFGTDNYDRLSELGRRQAGIAAAALSLRGVAVSRVFSGSLERQLDTAAPVAAAFALEIETDPRWNEYSMDDILAAHHHADVSTAHPGTDSDSFQDLLDGAIAAWIDAGDSSPASETWPAFHARSIGAVSDAAASLGSGQTAVIATSGGVIAAICAQLLDADPRQMIRFNRVVVNGALTKISVGRRGQSLIAFNDHSHLENVGRELITYR